MTRKTISALLTMLIFAENGTAQGMLLTLDSCRTLAMSKNKELRMADDQVRKTYYERKAAFTNYLPRITATGAYMRTSKEISLLNNEQKQTLGDLGTTMSALIPQLEGISETLNGLGQTLVDALHTDTRNMTTAALMLTQPIYMGGKIVAYNRITKYAEQIARNNHDLALQNVIVEIDETYWRIVAIQTKKKLAESYL